MFILRYQHLYPFAASHSRDENGVGIHRGKSRMTSAESGAQMPLASDFHSSGTTAEGCLDMPLNSR
jgi:hypothetical protein